MSISIIKLVSDKRRVSFSLFKLESSVTVDWGDGCVETFAPDKYRDAHCKHICRRKGSAITITSTSVGAFQCQSNKLSEIDLSQCPTLKHLDCVGNNIARLDLSGCPELETLECSDNLLTELDTSANPRLKNLRCDCNDIERLDLGANLELDALICYTNLIGELNVDNHKKLRLVNCETNLLRELVVDNCPKLTHLECHGNKIEAVRLTKLPKLDTLNLSRNCLATLETGHLHTLSHLYVWGNSFTEFRLDGFAKLWEVTISDCPPLSTLSITNCKILRNISCENNGLTQIEFGRNPNVVYFDCSKNRLSAEKLNDLFAHLGNRDSKASGLGLDISKNPGAKTCDRQIATAKGWSFDEE